MRSTSKYQPHLQQNGTDSKIKDAWTKIKWAVCKIDDLERFRADIRGHTSSIQILLLTMQMEVLTANARKDEARQRSLAGRIQDFSFQVMDKLCTITENVAQSVELGKRLLESSVRIIQINLGIFQIVHDMQLSILRIPGQVQRQQPVCFIDPLNREMPFHLEFIKSPEALLSVLKINLRETGCGPAMIDRGEFVIEEAAPRTLIDLTAPWDRCFFPGQRVAMSMVFICASSSCPECNQALSSFRAKMKTW